MILDFLLRCEGGIFGLAQYSQHLLIAQRNLNSAETIAKKPRACARGSPACSASAFI
jgi:hypothetical protein